MFQGAARPIAGQFRIIQSLGGEIRTGVPVERLEQLADPDDADGDGISGRVHRITTRRGDIMRARPVAVPPLPAPPAPTPGPWVIG